MGIRVLAIDPGYDRMGVAVLERNELREVLLYSTCLETSRTASLAERLDHLGRSLSKLLREYEPSDVAIETLFFNKNVKTALGVAHARGVVLYLATACGARVQEFGPQEVKVAVTGYGKSDKRAVYDMVRRLVAGVPDKAHDDEYDAIAIGITCLAHHR